VAEAATGAGFGAVGAIALPAMLQEGVFFPLVSGALFILPVLQGITRARAAAPREN
jgi:hypothetical protein